MRCFFMKKGRICAVEFLEGSDDEGRIAEAMELFKSRGLAIGAEGFEVWDQARFVYRFVAEGTAETKPLADGLNRLPDWWQRLIRTPKLKFASLENMSAQVFAAI
jgi:hypothetical protein